MLAVRPQALRHYVVAGRQEIGPHRPTVNALLNLPVNAPDRVVANKHLNRQVVADHGVDLHAVETQRAIAVCKHDLVARQRNLCAHCVGQPDADHAEARNVVEPVRLISLDRSTQEVAVVATVERDVRIVINEFSQCFRHIHGMHRVFCLPQCIEIGMPLLVSRPHGSDPLGSLRPTTLFRGIGQLRDDVAEVADYAYSRRTGPGDLRGRRVDHDKFRIRSERRTAAETKRVIEFLSEHQHDIGISNMLHRRVEGLVSESHRILVGVRNKGPCRILGYKRNAHRLNETSHLRGFRSCTG